MNKILVLHEKDNVGVLLEAAEKGAVCAYGDDAVEILESIAFAHKVALDDISKEGRVIKYGEDIGFATKDIKKGQWVHVHNIGCNRGK